MIGFKGLTGGLVGVLLTGAGAMADAAPERGACVRGACVRGASAPAVSWSNDGACGTTLRGGHRRGLRPVLGAVDGYSAVTLLRSTPVRFTSLLILGVGY